jgi:hypothetical protein
VTVRIEEMLKDSKRERKERTRSHEDKGEEREQSGGVIDSEEVNRLKLHRTFLL